MPSHTHTITLGENPRNTLHRYNFQVFTILYNILRKCRSVVLLGDVVIVITNAISLHRWPKDDKTRRLWTKFVQNTWSDFTGPSQYSSVCSEHFTEADYDPSFLLKEEMGLTGGQKRVLPCKYPTLKTPKIRSGEQETSSGLSFDPLEEAGPSTTSSSMDTSKFGHLSLKHPKTISSGLNHLKIYLIWWENCVILRYTAKHFFPANCFHIVFQEDSS
ncbi:putative THAP domain-containing protein 10-like [Apostichopus japonicus]|uniref:Putative THAP domain-containing protein 10-like n=1 Tax=Stichopus japonicus TaxID=307972 RepID=A0A2G8L112_STIJA|nr:putative THAP domain-containing protein 10-like [Apostichopus japonicus]